MAINPETTEWVRALLQQEIDRAVAPLRQEIDQLDDWANGVFCALSDLMPALLKTQPEIARYLEPLWRKASERYDHIGNTDQAEDFHETQPLLEARMTLYRQLASVRAWPVPAQEK